MEFILRVKVHRLTNNGQDPPHQMAEEEDLMNNEEFVSNVPMDIDAIDKNDQKALNSQIYRDARHQLKQFLQVRYCFNKKKRVYKVVNLIKSKYKKFTGKIRPIKTL